MTNLNEALEVVREALENPLCIEKGNIAGLKWREHDATDALAALSQIEARLGSLEAKLATLDSMYERECELASDAVEIANDQALRRTEAEARLAQAEALLKRWVDASPEYSYEDFRDTRNYFTEEGT